MKFYKYPIFLSCCFLIACGGGSNTPKGSDKTPPVITQPDKDPIDVDDPPIGGDINDSNKAKIFGQIFSDNELEKVACIDLNQDLFCNSPLETTVLVNNQNYYELPAPLSSGQYQIIVQTVAEPAQFVNFRTVNYQAELDEHEFNISSLTTLVSLFNLQQANAATANDNLPISASLMSEWQLDEADLNLDPLVNSHLFHIVQVSHVTAELLKRLETNTHDSAKTDLEYYQTIVTYWHQYGYDVEAWVLAANPYLLLNQQAFIAESAQEFINVVAKTSAHELQLAQRLSLKDDYLTYLSTWYELIEFGLDTGNEELLATMTECAINECAIHTMQVADDSMVVEAADNISYLTWDNVADADAYRVYISLDSDEGGYELIQVADVNENKIELAAYDTSAHYKIAIIKSGLLSDFSNEFTPEPLSIIGQCLSSNVWLPTSESSVDI